MYCFVRPTMNFPQSILQQLLSHPREDALKILDVWRSNHVGNKRVIGDPTSISKYDPIVYDQLFRAPPQKLREPNKLYGRDFLKKEHPDQYRVLCGNYGFVRKWFAQALRPIGDLRNNNERKDIITNIIRENITQIKPIKVHGVDYFWLEQEIYNWCIKSLASKRKWSKKKSNEDLPCLTGSMVCYSLSKLSILLLR